MWKIKSTHDLVPDEQFDDKDLAELEMRILADGYAQQLGASIEHLPWCSVIYDDALNWRMMWVSRVDALNVP